MASNVLLNLSLGTSSFRGLRKANQIYVDKTRLIFDLASQRRKYLLVRPRGFGKSLLISTFETLFKNGLEDLTSKLAELEKQMDKGEIERAKKLAGEYSKGNFDK